LYLRSICHGRALHINSRRTTRWFTAADGATYKRREDGETLTEAELSQYRAIKQEIADLNRRIQEAKDGPIMSFGTVKGSSKYFPYTPQTFHVTGMDPADTDIRQNEISELLRQREVKRNELIRKQLEIEQYISEIPDSTTRTIFRMHFIDGENQIKVGSKLGYDQSVVSRKIRSYVKLHKKHNSK
jgi:hypothetical protein